MFQFHYVIGRGGFGKVWMVELLKSREFFAMKEMWKAKFCFFFFFYYFKNYSKKKHPFSYERTHTSQ